MLSDTDVRTELDKILERRTSSTRLTTMGAGSDDLEKGRAYLAATVASGWSQPTWPAAFGGRDAESDDAAIIGRVLAEYIVPDLYPYGVGLGMVGPTLLVHGTDDQRSRWMRSIADGSQIWCQMFSEPDAGSDLANVGMRAERDGEEWVLSGQKVWTSRGAYSQWGLCLARTAPELPKHQGLTMFGVAMDQPGVDVRPLVQMNGDRHFSEVFMNESRVADIDRIGDVGMGWKVAMTVLSYERAGMTRGGGDGQAREMRLPSWLADLAAVGKLDDRVRRERAMVVHSADMTARWTKARAAADPAPGPAGSGQKVRTSIGYQAKAYTVTDAAGAAGMLTDAPGHIELMTAPSMSIRGGTDEIQRNILGERVLGLPGEPRLDRDIPWSESRQGVV